MPFTIADHRLFMGVLKNDPARVRAALSQGADALHYSDDLDDGLPFRNAIEQAGLLGHQQVMAALLETLHDKGISLDNALSRTGPEVMKAVLECVTSKRPRPED